MKRIAFLAASAVAVIVAVVAMFAASLTATPAPAAVAQSTPPPPANQQARNTGTPGEVIVTWNAAAGANRYRVGWLNHADYLAAGNTWLQRFTFADVPSSVRSYRVTRLTPGEEYWFIVASVDAGNQMYWPSSWIQKFAVTATPTPTPAPTPTPCPTSHGPGAPTGGDGAMCPITGLPVGDGYLEVGDKADSGGLSYRLDEVTTPATVQFSRGGQRYTPFEGRQWVRTCGTVWNHYNFTTAQYAGSTVVIDSDAGIGFHFPLHNETPNRIAPGRSGKQCYTWDLPATASTAILAVNLYFDHETVRLFRIPIRTQAAGSDLCATSSGSALQALIQSGVCPAQ